jgi:hypothetical protein
MRRMLHPLFAMLVSLKDQIILRDNDGRFQKGIDEVFEAAR